MRTSFLACGFGFFASLALGANNGPSDFTTEGNRQKLESGTATLLVAPESSGQVSSNHAILRRGALQFTAAAGYRVQASSLQILAAASRAAGTIQVTDSGLIKISARAGVLRVEDATGGLVASLLPGETFSSNSLQPAEVRLRRCGGHDPHEHDAHNFDSHAADRDCPPVSPSRPPGR
jgi:hypothetical protein